MEATTKRKGWWEVEWAHTDDPYWVETSQIDAADPDEAVSVLRDLDDGYGQVGHIYSVRWREARG